MGALKVRVGGSWVTIPGYGNTLGVPAGGVLGDVLIKNSATDGDARWGTNPPLLNLTSAVILDLTSTTHPLTVGPTTSFNLALSSDRIQGRNNGAASLLRLNQYGGMVSIGGTHTDQYQTMLTINETAHATSRRASMTFGSGVTGWGVGKDINANGANDFYIYNNPNSRIAFQISADGLTVSIPQNLTFSSYGGGWYMSDSTWIRAVGNKNVYTPGEIRAGSTFSFDGTGYKFNNSTDTDSGIYYWSDGKIALVGNGNYGFQVDGGVTRIWGNTQFWSSQGATDWLHIDTGMGGPGIYWNVLGAGWFAQDSTYMRLYGDRQIWLNNGFYGTNGAFIANRGGTAAGFTGPNEKFIAQGQTHSRYTGFIDSNKNWAQCQLILSNDTAQGNAPNVGLSSNPVNTGTAPIMRVVSNGEECYGFVNNPNTAYVLIRASAFTVTSTLREKIDVVDVEPMELLDRVATLRPIRYRPAVRPQHLRRDPDRYLAAKARMKPQQNAVTGLWEVPEPLNSEYLVSHDHVCGIDCVDVATNPARSLDNPCLVGLNDRAYIGIAAEALHDVLPEAVHYDEQGLPDGYDSASVAATALALVGELRRQLITIETRLNAVEAA